MNHMPPITALTIRLMDVAVLALALSLSGCVVYPARVTYHEASSSMGEPQFDTCATLTRRTEVHYHGSNVELVIDGSYKGGIVDVGGYSFLPGPDALRLDQRKIRVVAASGGQLLATHDIEVRSDPNRYPFGGYHTAFTQSFAASDEQGQDFQVFFDPGAVTINGQDYPLAPVRFQEVTRWAAELFGFTC